jgi:hypothetical protein
VRNARVERMEPPGMETGYRSGSAAREGFAPGLKPLAAERRIRLHREFQGAR